MPRLRDWRRERVLLILLLLALAPIIWAMLVAVAVAAIIPHDRTPTGPERPEISVTVRVIRVRVEVTVIFSDPNPGDIHSAVIRWRDGSPPTVLSRVTSPVEACHIYTTLGEFVVEALVRDSEGLEAVDTATVTIGPPLVNPYLIPVDVEDC